MTPLASHIAPELWLGVLALLGSAGIGAVVTKVLNRGVDSATAEKLHAETRQAAVNSSASEVEVIRAVMAELRATEQQKTGEIAELKADMNAMKDRVGKLEERERHMLTRAAVHEAWDQLAFSLLVQLNPQHPPPPPIVPRAYRNDNNQDEDELFSLIREGHEHPKDDEVDGDDARSPA